MSTDIAMCQNKDCPSREECYRYEAIPDQYQAYGLFLQEESGKCESFIKVN